MLSKAARLRMSILACGTLSGCSGMRAEQSALVSRWESRAAEMGRPDVRYREVKDPDTAGWLGVLPGAGGFYTGRTGLGVAGLLTWPLSIAWEPASAHSAAYDYNFAKFRDQMIDVGVQQADVDERTLEQQLTSKQIPSEVYQARRDRLRSCKEQLGAQRGLHAAVASRPRSA